MFLIKAKGRTPVLSAWDSKSGATRHYQTVTKELAFDHGFVYYDHKEGWAMGMETDSGMDLFIAYKYDEGSAEDLDELGKMAAKARQEGSGRYAV